MTGRSGGNPNSDNYLLYKCCNNAYFGYNSPFIYFDHPFAFKILKESVITKVLRLCHDTPCIINGGRPRFHSYLVNTAFVSRHSEEKRRLHFLHDKE